MYAIVTIISIYTISIEFSSNMLRLKLFTYAFVAGILPCSADCLFFFWQMSPILNAFFHHGWRMARGVSSSCAHVTSTVKTPIKYPEKFCDLGNHLHQAQHLRAMHAELASLLTSMVKHIWASDEA